MSSPLLPPILQGRSFPDPLSIERNRRREREDETERRIAAAALAGEPTYEEFRAPFLGMPLQGQQLPVPADRRIPTDERIARGRHFAEGLLNTPFSNISPPVPLLPDTNPLPPAALPERPGDPVRSAPSSSAASSPARALRLPGGKILFTNQPTGSEIPEFRNAETLSTRAAGREIRDRDHDTIARMQQERMPAEGTLADEFDFQAVSPTRDLASDLIRRSADVEFRRSRGEDLPDGGLTMIPAMTPETQDRLAIEGGERELQLAQLNNAIQEANRSPEARAADRNLNLQTFNKVFPLITEAQNRIAGMNDPGSPLFIEDPNVRAQAAEFERAQITAILQAAGLSRPTSYLE